MNRDPRLTLARDGIAARGLEGVVAAETYADTAPMRLAFSQAAVLRENDSQSETVDQLLFGEVFDVLYQERHFALGQARRDGYVGWVETSVLAPVQAPPTHRVSALRTHAFYAPDFKAPPSDVGPLSMNSLVRVLEVEGRYALCQGAGWIPVEHLAPLGRVETDAVAVAERFVGAPYLWGGRSSLGLDCSGLVQQALYACGRACPRDSDLQRAAFPVIDRATARRGDLVFWPDHVGLLLDEARMIHANARTMDVAVEALDFVIGLREADEGLPSFARP